PSPLVAPGICPELDPEEEETVARGYVAAEICCESVACTNCTTFYTYTITVDDTLLAEDVTLVGTDITGILCDNCQTQFVRDVFGEEPYVDTDGEGNQSFISNHGCVYPLSIPAAPVWQTWVPTYSGNDGMTFASVTTHFARYIEFGDTVYFVISAEGTTGTPG